MSDCDYELVLFCGLNILEAYSISLDIGYKDVKCAVCRLCKYLSFDFLF